MWYWLFKYIFMGPLLTLLGRPKVEGLEYVPDSGAVILASNHLAVADSFYLPLVVGAGSRSWPNPSTSRAPGSRAGSSAGSTPRPVRFPSTAPTPTPRRLPSRPLRGC